MKPPLKSGSTQGRGISRRTFVGSGTAAGIACVASGTPLASLAQTPAARKGNRFVSEAAYRDNIYTRLLGVRPHLGAHEHISRLGGARLSQEVVDAMAEANEFFIDMDELTAAAGRRVAEILGAEAALVTAGAFSAMILGAAACLTGTDQEKIDALPHPTWPKRECLIQKAHRFSYDRAYRAAGMTIVEAGTREEFIQSISERTAMIGVLPAALRQGQFGPPVPRRLAMPVPPETMKPEEFIELGRRSGVPVLVDPASEIPPWENLTRYLRLGADLVALSGGKAIHGPQSTGILAGRADLIRAATLHSAPNGNIGRGMKVDRSEIIGLVSALQRFVSVDHEAEAAEWNRKARWIADQLQGIPGLRAEYALNTSGYFDVDLSWDESVIRLTEEQVRQGLKAGSPSLVYDGTTVRTRNLRSGEELLVARRLRQFFETAGRTG